MNAPWVLEKLEKLENLNNEPRLAGLDASHGDLVA
jgi:hypothetical protein